MYCKTLGHEIQWLLFERKCTTLCIMATVLLCGKFSRECQNGVCIICYINVWSKMARNCTYHNRSLRKKVAQAPELAFFVFTLRALNKHPVIAMNAPLGEPPGFTYTLSALVARVHCTGPGQGQRLGNDGFLYCIMYCAHYAWTGTGTWNHSFLLCPSRSLVPCSVSEPRDQERGNGYATHWSWSRSLHSVYSYSSQSHRPPGHSMILPGTIPETPISREWSQQLEWSVRVVPTGRTPLWIALSKA